MVSVCLFSQLCNANTLVINSARQSQLNAFCISATLTSVSHLNLSCFTNNRTTSSRAASGCFWIEARAHAALTHAPSLSVCLGFMNADAICTMPGMRTRDAVSDDGTSANACQTRASLACGDMRPSSQWGPRVLKVYTFACHLY